MHHGVHLDVAIIERVCNGEKENTGGKTFARSNILTTGWFDKNERGSLQENATNGRFHGGDIY